MSDVRAVSDLNGVKSADSSIAQECVHAAQGNAPEPESVAPEPASPWKKLGEVLLYLGGALRQADAWAGKWFFLLLILCACIYYGLYFQHGLNLTGEGGTTAVLAQRLLEGQRPISDTFLGYNVGWFAPITALFAVTGPDFTVMRAFFYCVSLLSAILGALMVWRIGRSGLLALAVGIILILIPGMQFRTYMGFLGVFNQFVLLWAFLWPVAQERERAWRLAVAGGALGVTYLIRIEVGLLLTPVYCGLWILGPLWWGQMRRRLPWAMAGGVGAVCFWMLVHLPVAWDAQRRGYDDNFWSLYQSFPRYLLHLWQEKKQLLLFGEVEEGAECLVAATTSATDGAPKWVHVSSAAPAVESTIHAPVEPAIHASVESAIQPTVESASVPSTDLTGVVVTREDLGSVVSSWRQRPPIKEMFAGRGQRERYFAAAVYVPILILGVWVAGGLVAFFWAYVRHRESLRTDALTVLTLSAGALALFPQYFFFRPDTPHITEFMIPFIPAVAATMALLWRRWQENPAPLRWILGILGTIAFGVTVWLHFGHAWAKKSSGSIALRVPGGVEFRGQNGVVAQVTPEEAEGLRELLRVVTAHSGPEDYLAAMPYAPTINFFTARRSYLWNLYMDDANGGEWFEQDQIARILRYRPPVLVIDNRAVNRSEASRFRNWAPGLYGFIRAHYRLEGIYLGQEVYVLEGGPAPLPTEPSGGIAPSLPSA